MHTARGAQVSRWRNPGMAGLLAFLILGMFVLPTIFQPGDDAIAGADKIVVALILACGIVAIAEYRRVAAGLAALATTIVVAWVLQAFGLMKLPPVWQDGLVLMALVLLAVAIGVSVFGGHRTTGDRLFGAIGLYLLLGLTWAAVYAIVAASVPGAFAGSLPTRPTLYDLGYFSLVTLTTVGYGDITPAAQVARSLAASEALIGQLYPAIIIARLVSAQAPAVDD